MRRPWRAVGWLVVGLLTLAWGASAPRRVLRGEEPESLFKSKIAPVLEQHCYRCHSAKATEIQGGLRVDSRESLLSGGDSGAAIVPEDVDASLLITALRYTDDFYQMPPDGRLDDDVIADFVKWVESGAK